MKVYVIQKGSYSSRYIVGVAIDKKKAEEIAEVVSGTDDYNQADVEEFDTDQFDIGLIRYVVDLVEGTVEYDEYGFYDNYKENGMIYTNYYVVYAPNKEEALKIARDMKAEYEAEKQGIKN